LPKDIGLGMKMSMFDASLNGHYLFRLSDKFSFYPLVGLGILNSKLKEGSGGDDDDFGDWGAYADYDDDADYGDDADGLSDTDFGFNVGAGFDLKLSEKLLLNVQAKYMLAGDWGRLIPSVGITYKF
jgi:opacity protein-like surface antigen